MTPAKQSGNGSVPKSQSLSRGNDVQRFVDCSKSTFDLHGRCCAFSPPPHYLQTTQAQLMLPYLTPVAIIQLPRCPPLHHYISDHHARWLHHLPPFESLEKEGKLTFLCSGGPRFSTLEPSLPDPQDKPEVVPLLTCILGLGSTLCHRSQHLASQGSPQTRKYLGTRVSQHKQLQGPPLPTTLPLNCFCSCVCHTFLQRPKAYQAPCRFAKTTQLIARFRRNPFPPPHSHPSFILSIE